MISFASTFILALIAAIIMAVGMGIANAALFKLVPEYVPDAIGGAAGWVGGLGAFGGFAIPPVMGAFVTASGTAGYAQGFVVFVVLAVISFFFAWVLKGSSERTV